MKTQFEQMMNGLNDVEAFLGVSAVNLTHVGDEPPLQPVRAFGRIDLEI